MANGNIFNIVICIVFLILGTVSFIIAISCDAWWHLLVCFVYLTAAWASYNDDVFGIS
jgi:hypothetical protein